ncbi:4630_t:CDS:2 [Dentiscutata erythropus]|uniref:4630_t:CDS:1 n=1 Tax=Dentiscutata erythropus TaxID=1348616 RepID=A0A9N9CEG7_9GLOM|nr:4630_t:CDS:2 [Dentiscutata erythropus]
MEWKYAQQKDPSRLLIDYNKLKQDNVRLEWEYNKLSRTHEISITEAIIERHTLKCEAIEFKENARHAKEQHIIAQASLEILTLENRLLTTESNLLQQEIKKLTEENFNLEEELDKLKVLYENACEKFSLLNQQKDSFAKKYIESQQIKSLDSEEKESLLDKLKLINEQLNQQVQEKENLQLCIDQLRTENKNLVSELKVENEQLQHQLAEIGLMEAETISADLRLFTT